MTLELGRTNIKIEAWTSWDIVVGKHFVCIRSSHPVILGL